MTVISLSGRKILLGDALHILAGHFADESA